MASAARTVTNFEPETAELAMAHQLMAQEHGVGRNTLYELLGRPKRYSELKHLVEGRSDNSLTVALKTLRRNGLIDQRTDARSDPPVQRYELTPYGIRVVLAMQTVQPIQDQLATLIGVLRAGQSTAPGPASGELMDQATDQGRAANVYHVAPDPDQGWRVERQGAQRATRVVDTKREALRIAKGLIEGQAGRTIVVHRADGSFQRVVRG